MEIIMDKSFYICDERLGCIDCPITHPNEEPCNHMIEVAHVVHGKWHSIDFTGTVRCSICGYETSAEIPFIDNGEKWVPLYANNYCGNCGAKMDGERKDND